MAKAIVIYKGEGITHKDTVFYKMYIVFKKNEEGIRQLIGEGGYDGLEQRLAKVLILEIVACHQFQKGRETVSR